MQLIILLSLSRSEGPWLGEGARLPPAPAAGRRRRELGLEPSLPQGRTHPQVQRQFLGDPAGQLRRRRAERHVSDGLELRSCRTQRGPAGPGRAAGVGAAGPRPDTGLPRSAPTPPAQPAAAWAAGQCCSSPGPDSPLLPALAAPSQPAVTHGFPEFRRKWAETSPAGRRPSTRALGAL